MSSTINNYLYSKIKKDQTNFSTKTVAITIAAAIAGGVALIKLIQSLPSKEQSKIYKTNKFEVQGELYYVIERQPIGFIIVGQDLPSLQVAKFFIDGISDEVDVTESDSKFVAMSGKELAVKYPDRIELKPEVEVLT